jgi:hypothetical protein
MPTRGEFAVRSLTIQVDVPKVWAEEANRFDAQVAASDWDGLLTVYPLRESRAFDCVVRALRLADKQTYRDVVLKLLQDDATALAETRSLFGDLYSEVAR